MSAKFEKHPLKTVREVDYTNSISYSAKKRPKRLSLKGCYSVNINSSSIKNSHAHFQYVHNTSAKFEKHPLKTGRGVDNTNFIHESVTKGRTDRRTDRGKS